MGMIGVSCGRRAAGALLFLFMLAGAAHAQAEESITLRSGEASMTLTPRFGGRVSALSLDGRASLIAFDAEAAGQAGAGPVSAATPHPGVLGHVLWLGPQSQWWRHQSVAPEKDEETWPPDPWRAVARAEPVTREGEAVTLRSEPSPVSGMRVTQRFAAVPDIPGAFSLQARAENAREESVAWDLWFVTRVPAAAEVYAPAASADAVHVLNMSGDPETAPAFAVQGGLFHMQPAPGAAGQQGKMFVAPSAGWMAAFHDGQAFLITFGLSEESEIHEDQAQLEFYVDDRPGAPLGGFIEMELHAPFETLMPGEAMEAAERWQVLPYEGADTDAARRDFLRRHLDWPRD